MRTQSTRALAGQFAQQTDEVFLVLLTMTHPSLAVPIRVVNNNEDVVSRGNNYIALGFEVSLPGEEPDRPTLASLKIDNVDRTVIVALRQILTPPLVTLEVVLAGTPSTVEASFTGLILRNVIYDEATITGELAFEQILVEPVSISIVPARFPGLF